MAASIDSEIRDEINSMFQYGGKLQGKASNPFFVTSEVTALFPDECDENGRATYTLKPKYSHKTFKDEYKLELSRGATKYNRVKLVDGRGIEIAGWQIEYSGTCVY